MSLIAEWWNRTEGAKVTADERKLFLMSYFAANKDLVIDFLDESAVQISGLAMGIACSPDLANLYGAHYENEILSDEVLKSQIPFFGRYLDDLLCIVYATSANEAMSLACRIKYEGVEIEWAVSEWHTPFLDMFVYLDPVTKTIEHKPYRKPLHHRERIPWASHHPKDVKKGTYIGEMSRLATLSSRLEHYQEAIADLRSLYVARGYPDALVRKWTLEFYGKRWEDRLGAPTAQENSFVLKSHFNPVWSAFNVHELGKIVTDSWLSSLAEFDELKRSAVVGYQSLGPKPGASYSKGASDASASTAKARQPPVPRSEPVSGLARVPASLVERDGATITVSSIADWEAAGSPLLDRSLVHNPPLEVSIARRRLLLDKGSHVGGSAIHDPHLSEASSTRSLAGPSSERMEVDEEPSGDPAEDGGEPPVAAGDVDNRSPSVGRLIATRLRKGKLVESVLDVRSVGYCDKNWLVSRKKTRNLGDIVNSWKNSLLKSASDGDVVAMHVDEWQ